MSKALVIASVTSVLRGLLRHSLDNDGLQPVLGDQVAITTVPPDTIPLGVSDAKPQLNLFFFQLSHNTNWRTPAPSRRISAQSIVRPSPLALDLHYLVTAYGREELHTEILLDFVLCALDQQAVLNQQSIQSAQSGSAIGAAVGSPVDRMLANASDAGQLQQLRITPTVFSTQDMSALWSAMHAHYRPSLVYTVSALLQQTLPPMINVDANSAE